MDATTDAEDDPLPGEEKCTEHLFHFVSEAPYQGLQPDQRHLIRSHVMKRYQHQQSHRRTQLAEARSRGRGENRPLAIAPAPQKYTDDEITEEPLAGSSPLPRQVGRDAEVIGPNKDRPTVGKYTSKVAPRRELVNRPRQLLTAVNPSASQSTSHVPIGGAAEVMSMPTPTPAQTRTQSFCLLCGAPQIAWLKGKDVRSQENDHEALVSYILSSEASPLQPLGAGRVDPFVSYPAENATPYTKELMDHAIVYLLPGLVPDVTSADFNLVSKAWFASGFQHPLLFHALVFAGSIHLDYLRWSKIYPNKPVALSHKITVIQKLNECLSDPEIASRDEVILAILILASHEAIQIPEKKKSPFNSPLKDAQWLNVYSSIIYVEEHMKAVMELVIKKGGLENIQMYGLAETIVAGDVIAATNSLTKPILPPMSIAQDWIEHIIRWAKLPPRPSIQTQALAFSKFLDRGLTPDALRVFQVMGATTIAIDYHIQGKPGLTLGVITKIRTFLQQRLLLLPETLETSEFPTSAAKFYESCRTTALIYALAVIFPVSTATTLLEILVQRLKSSLLAANVDNWDREVWDLKLWMLVLGGIAASGTPERPWFVAQLKSCTREWKISEWATVEEVLESFLWLESACSLGGRLLWMEVLQR